MALKLLNKQNKIKPLSLRTLFTESFMKKYTDYTIIDEFFEGGNFIVNSHNDIQPIRRDLDSYVQETTEFSCWQNMLNKAGAEFICKIISAKETNMD